MSLPFIIPKSIYETAVCLGHCLMDRQPLISGTLQAKMILQSSGLEAWKWKDWQDWVTIFRAHQQKERLPGVIWHAVSNTERPKFVVKMEEVS